MAAKSEQRKRDLLNATSLVISEKGLSGVSVRAVAEKAAVSFGSVLYHFDNFDHLVESAIRGAIDEFIDRRRRIAQQHSDPVARIRALIEAGIPTRISDDLKVVYEASASMRVEPRYQPLMELLSERQVALYETAIEVGTALGAFRPRMDVLALATNLVALEDAYDLYLLAPGNVRHRESYLRNTLSFAEVALDCTLADPAEKEDAA